MPTPRPRPERPSNRTDAKQRAIHRAARLTLAAALLGSTACYNYQPVGVSELKPEMDVRVQLSAVGVDRIRTGPNNEGRLLDNFSVSGKVSRVSADSVILSVQSSTNSDPSVRAMTFFQPLPLLRSELRSTEVRRLDRKRTTWTAVIISAAAIGASVYAITHGGEASGSTPVPGGPNEVRVPLLGFRLP
jgi:hypothetical protein